MGKFSINSISGFGEENKKENTIPEERYMLGIGGQEQRHC